ncbi:Amidophosphoribosyltransferase [Planctomycetales bacterium 10988]|nr:Amidophosphoribosyltransferase [Planctomycetales bacterium 10988]
MGKNPGWEKWQRWLKASAELFYPTYCLGCEAMLEEPTDEMALCPTCQEELNATARPYCTRCGLSLPGFNQLEESEKPLFSANESGCIRCRSEKVPFAYHFRLGIYQGLLRSLILQMKHDRSGQIAKTLAEAAWQRQGITLQSLPLDVIVPIPMHWQRRWDRGLNAPEVIAETLGRRLNLPAKNILQRKRATTMQAQRSATQRAENVKGAFEVRPKTDLSGKSVLLVDDILTTGATCREAAKVLKRAGAKDTSVLVLGRAETG